MNGTRSQWTTLRPSDAKTQLRQIELVERYIEANWTKPITSTELKLVANATGKDLANAFQKTRGYLPMAFLIKVRLRHARQMLGEPDTIDVAEVCEACHFDILQRFIKAYGIEFKEPPARTLARARQRVRQSGLPHMEPSK